MHNWKKTNKQSSCTTKVNCLKGQRSYFWRWSGGYVKFCTRPVKEVLLELPVWHSWHIHPRSESFLYNQQWLDACIQTQGLPWLWLQVWKDTWICMLVLCCIKWESIFFHLRDLRQSCYWQSECTSCQSLIKPCQIQTLNSIVNWLHDSDLQLIEQMFERQKPVVVPYTATERSRSKVFITSLLFVWFCFWICQLNRNFKMIH